MTGVLCVGRVDRVPSENRKHSNAFKFVAILQCSLTYRINSQWLSNWLFNL